MTTLELADSLYQLALDYRAGRIGRDEWLAHRGNVWRIAGIYGLVAALKETVHRDTGIR